jgi:hypothetical protein
MLAGMAAFNTIAARATSLKCAIHHMAASGVPAYGR